MSHVRIPLDALKIFLRFLPIKFICSDSTSKNRNVCWNERVEKHHKRGDQGLNQVVEHRRKS